MVIADTLPHVNASLNFISTVLLISGFFFIKNDKKVVHARIMISAIIVSSIFLLSYLVYHFTSPIFLFKGEGDIRYLYYFILISHVILAIVVIPFIFLTLRAALIGDFRKHPKVARFTLLVWLYVTFTGMIIYYMLYHLYP